MLKKEILINRMKYIGDVYKKEANEPSINRNHIIEQQQFLERQLKYYKNEICKEQLIIQTNIEKVENIMIVAHPDDETIFGINELYNNENWLLIVCTNSRDGRIGLLRKDIPGLIQMSKDYRFNLVVIQHIDFYEEKIINARFDIKVYNYLKKYLLKQKWNKVITHNKDGEYGHSHHIMVHRIVSNILYNNPNNYKMFKVFDFNDKIKNDHLIIEKILLKYYLMNGNILQFKADKVFFKNEEPVNYDMVHILCE